METNAAFLESVRLQIEEIEKEFQNLINGLSNEQLQWKPGANKWSIAECTEHLHIAVSGYINNVKNAEKNKQFIKAVSGKTYKAGLIGKIMNYFVRPDNRNKKIPAPGHMKPGKSKHTKEILIQFQDTLKAFKNITFLAENTDLNITKIPSPVTSLLILKLGDVFEVNIQHIKRHFLQIREVKNNPQFPS